MELENSGLTLEESVLVLELCDEKSDPLCWVQNQWQPMVKQVQKAAAQNRIPLSHDSAVEALRESRGDIDKAVQIAVNRQKDRVSVENCNS